MIFVMYTREKTFCHIPEVRKIKLGCNVTYLCQFIPVHACETLILSPCWKGDLLAQALYSQILMLESEWICKSATEKS